MHKHAKRPSPAKRTGQTEQGRHRPEEKAPTKASLPLGLTLTLAIGGQGLNATLDSGAELNLPIDDPTGEAIAELLRRQAERRGLTLRAKPLKAPTLLQASVPVRRYTESGKLELDEETLLQELNFQG